MAPIHATCVARHGKAGWRAVLLTGRSGSGKSELAARLIGRGWRLVSDDYTLVWRSGEAVHATAPARLVGRIERRGLGITPAPLRWIARVALVIDCVPGPVERLPDPWTQTIAGLALPAFRLDSRSAAAPDTVIAALDGL